MHWSTFIPVFILFFVLGVLLPTWIASVADRTRTRR